MSSSLQTTALHCSESEHVHISVQELIKCQKITMPPQRYIRSDIQEHPNNNLLDGNHSTAIPTIDMKSLVSHQEDKDSQELEKLHATCKEWGIFQLVNHGVSSSLMEKLKYEIQEFYNLPVEEKMKYKIKPGDVEGYGNVTRSEGKLDWGDRFFMTTNPIQRRKQHLLPELPLSFRNSIESYLFELQQLGRKLFEMIGKAMKIEVKEMEEMFEDGLQLVRMTYYPPCPQPELVMGITPHSDATGITILNQVNGVNGLQIKKDGVWIPVSFLPDSLVVNIGDVLQIMSNGMYRSMEHRATVNSEKERISIAFFMNPKFEAEVGPSTSLINPQNPPLFKRIGMEDYVKGFFSSNLNGKSYLDKMKIQNGDHTNN
ncbi:hypothetical protein Ddye_024424 [Dipteronia dyeriana]|uniref:Fe2OG dioxygenase domain-containing protein n=1 Tax=Dipteronia dyeriana TaxID=168575 RepID=A0AAD9WTK8_9ROSI|nr:hypothetical protein Ddye_024424 [Dipteronia dyeriana]